MANARKMLVDSASRHNENKARRRELDREIRKRLRAIPELDYRTRSVLFDMNGINITPTTMVMASLLSKTNVLLIGFQGKVKTEFAKYIRDEWFNGEAAFLRGRKDLTAASAFLDLRLDLARSGAKNDKEIVEANEASRYQLVIVDELNRIPEVVQQEVFPISDGHVEKDGKVIYLGKQINGDPQQRYVAIIASANIGEIFRGTFEIDKALLDRYTILDLDLFPTDGASYMSYLMFGSHKKKGDAGFSEIYQLFNEYYRLTMGDPKYGFAISLLAEFMRSGLTLCTKDNVNKSAIEAKIRRTDFCGGCNDKPRGCNYVPLTFERGVEISTRIFLALDLATRAAMGDRADSELDATTIPVGLAKVHAFRLGPIMKITHMLDQMMVNDTQLNPQQIISKISEFIMNEINNAKNEVEKLMREANAIMNGRQKEFSNDVVSWFMKSRWAGAFEGIRGIVEE